MNMIQVRAPRRTDGKFLSAARPVSYCVEGDSADIGKVKSWCAKHDVRMEELQRLGCAILTVAPDRREEFLSEIKHFPGELNVTQGTPIGFEGFTDSAEVKPSHFGKIPTRGYALDILNMRKVHDGPLGKFAGKGETICIIDSGIYAGHPDFLDANGKSRLKWFVDLVEGKEGLQYANDPLGHGTHMCGDAAGTGKASGGLFSGTAPEAELVVLKVDTDLDALKAIDWVLANGEKYGIDVVSLSIGVPATGSYKTDPLAKAVGRLIDKGIFVTAAAGNEGAEASINSPGIHPDVVTATALETPDGTNVKRFTVSPAASEGPPPYDKDIVKPNLALPGANIYGPLAPGSLLDPQEPAVTPFGKYYLLSGTSPPCQMAAGIIACIHQALKAKGLSMTPREMLGVLEDTANPIYDQQTGKPLSAFRQGAGVPDGFNALSLALSRAAAKKAQAA